MGNRNYNRRSGRRGPRYKKAREPRDKPIDILVYAFLDGIAASFRLLGRGITWLWHRPTKIQSLGHSPRPPYTPSPRPPALPLSHAIPIAAPVLGRQVPPERPIETLPYRRASSLLSRGERALWYPLYRAVKGKYRIFCKVRLADIVCCPSDRKDERRWFRKIGRYHVDFVVCQPRTTSPLLVIELDGTRHRQRRQRERDYFKDDVLRAAGVPTYRIRAQAAYDPIELAQNINRLIDGQKP